MVLRRWKDHSEQSSPVHSPSDILCSGRSSAAVVANDTVLWLCVLPCFKKLVTLLCKPNRGPGLALGPLRAPEYESRLNSRCRVPLSTFSCRFYQLKWWSPAEVHWTVHVDFHVDKSRHFR